MLDEDVDRRDCYLNNAGTYGTNTPTSLMQFDSRFSGPEQATIGFMEDNPWVRGCQP